MLTIVPVATSPLRRWMPCLVLLVRNHYLTGSISVNGKKVGQGRIERTMGTLYSLAAETADIGYDSYSPVTDDYDPWENAFTGTIKKVTIKHKELQPA